MLIPTLIVMNDKRVRFEEPAANIPPSQTIQPTQQRHVSSCLQPQFCDVRRDFNGRKTIVAHKGPCFGNGPSANGGGGEDGKGEREDVKKGSSENRNGGAQNGGKKGEGDKNGDCHDKARCSLSLISYKI